MLNRKILLTNLFSLSGIQLINYLLPVLVVPYVVRIIGPDYYGLINFAQAFSLYFILIVNYGFDFSATREISVHRSDRQKLSEIFSSVISAKLILFIITLITFLPIIFFIPKLKSHFDLYLFYYLVIIGNIFLPVWMFQGLEKLTRLSIFNFLIKFSYAVLIFLFIKEREDYLFIPLLLSGIQIIAGAAAFIYSIKAFNISFYLPEKEKIKKMLKEGWNLFLSAVSINIYTASNIVILGFLAADLNVGYYSASSKIITVVQALLLAPMNQAFFPRISSVINKAKEEGIALLKKLTLTVGIIMFAASVPIFIFAGPIIKIVFGNKFMDAEDSLKIMAFLPFIIGLSNVFGLQGMLNLRMDREFLVLTLTGAILSIVLNLFLVPVFYENGTALSWLITEIFITASCFIALLRKGINLFDWKEVKLFHTER